MKNSTRVGEKSNCRDSRISRTHDCNRKEVEPGSHLTPFSFIISSLQLPPSSSPLIPSSGSIKMGSKDVSRVKWRRRRRRRQLEANAVDSKIKKLRQLVPGASQLKPERLFLRTAEHILQLRLQVNMLQALSKILKPK
ncbi:hypothetical protein K1719_017315 [Acacia pycnantha]|nr:hypothetical protein K1719_017315 [Acacia pycnantha]